jgi:acetoin utilization deacetylase AcuC-like enzyme
MSFYVAYAPVYVHAVPENHRFPMEKYALLSQQIAYEGLIEPTAFLQPQPIDLNAVTRVHSVDYLEKLLLLRCTPREQRVSGFVHNHELITRELTIMEGTRLCAEMVVNGGVALNIAGGTHHAYSNRGEDFCLLNDQAIAAQWLLDNELAQRILIIDLDVHQGNGTAQIFAGEPRVYTFSMHGASNYPMKKEQSDWDIALPDGCTDEQYLEQLQQALQQIQETFRPDFLFFQSGVDVLETDALGKLSLSLQGCKERDRLVFEFAVQQQLPIVCSMGGGYSKDVRLIVEAHSNTFRLAFQYFA